MSQQRLYAHALVGSAAVHRDVHTHEWIGARHRPIAAACEASPGLYQRSEHVLLGAGRLGHERQGEPFDSIFAARPERLRVRCDPRLGESGHVGRCDHLQVREVVSVVARTVHLARVLDSVETVSDGPVA